jgi:GNAT superfamily N-acetyltransferase
MLEIKDNVIDVESYLYLRSKVGWRELLESQAVMALQNSIVTKAAYLDGKLVGMGRIVGDRAVISYIQDLIVIPDAQSKGVGSKLLDSLIDYVKDMTIDGSQMMLCLMCAKGREKFYLKHDFIARPTPELGPGMIQYIRKFEEI